MIKRTTSVGGAPPKSSRRKAYSAPALEKGLDILELLAKEPESKSLKEIALLLGRSVGEIFRMLVVLEQRGFVRTDAGSERYQLSMKLFQLAHWHLPVNRLTKAASSPMRRLALLTGQSCHLATLSGTNIVILAKQDSFADRSFSMRVGAETPLLSSCSGRILYALADDLTRQTLLAKINETGDHSEQAEKAVKLASKIRRESLLEKASDQVSGVIDIGTPIFGHDGVGIAVLVVPFHRRIDRDESDLLARVRTALIEAGREISTGLGAD